MGVLSPFKGPLALVKPHVRLVVKAIKQSRKYDELLFVMPELLRNMKRIKMHIEKTGEQLRQTMNSAPNPSLKALKRDTNRGSKTGMIGSIGSGPFL